MDALAAFGYARAYDAVVRGFPPFERLLDEVASRVRRSATAARLDGPARVLDVACGTGTLARRLARDGHSVVGLDTVPRFVDLARATPATRATGRLAFHACDAARPPVPGAGTYDVLVSLHTLYWHPDPEALLRGCRGALRDGGHGVFLTYVRPPHAAATFRTLAARSGGAEAVRALRWLLPTAAFEVLRRGRRRYVDERGFHALLAGAGFEVLESRRTFLGDVSLLAWVRAAC